MKIVTLATGEKAAQEVLLLLWGIQQYHRDLPTVYLYTDAPTWKYIIQKNTYKGKLHMKDALSDYQGLTRLQMEKLPGRRFDTRWTDFMCEKINAMRWAFEESSSLEGVWFLDADITVLGPLPSLPPGCEVGVSPHYIKTRDEAKFGRYNGGFLWISEPKFLDVWEEATKTSRFFEQAALEDVAAAAKTVHEFPIQHNFGWWRLWQSEMGSTEMFSQFGFFRGASGIGLTFRGEPVYSIHTHWAEKEDYFINNFNKFILDRLGKLARHKPAAEFLGALKKYLQVSYT